MKNPTLLSLLALGALAPSARAAFFVDPTGGTSLGGFRNEGFLDFDDGSVLRSLGGSFSLYGGAVSSLYVNTNGFLSTGDNPILSASRSVGQLADAVPGRVIAPFYDDLYLETALSETVLESVTPSYYAVSYSISGYDDVTLAQKSNFQALLVKSATTLRGNALQAGDIVLSYGALDSTVQEGDFTVGVAASGANATGAFGATGLFATETSFLGNFNSASQALLFRYNAATGTYAQSVITAQPVPEPGTLAALGLAGALLLKRRRRA